LDNVLVFLLIRTDSIGGSRPSCHGLHAPSWLYDGCAPKHARGKSV
jgi:hypothetical protein